MGKTNTVAGDRRTYWKRLLDLPDYPLDVSEDFYGYVAVLLQAGAETERWRLEQGWSPHITWNGPRELSSVIWVDVAEAECVAAMASDAQQMLDFSQAAASPVPYACGHGLPCSIESEGWQPSAPSCGGCEDCTCKPRTTGGLCRHCGGFDEYPEQGDDGMVCCWQCAGRE